MAGTQVYNLMFEEDVITTTVMSSGKAVEDWLNEILSVHHRCLHKLVVGLVVGSRCLILQVIHADYFPDELEDFLGDSDYRFVDVGVEGDADRLRKDWQLKVAKTVDLAELAAEEMDRPSLLRAGPKDIASTVMGADMEKPYGVRTSNWDAYNLSGEQISYAFINAFVFSEVGRKLLSGDY